MSKRSYLVSLLMNAGANKYASDQMVQQCPHCFALVREYAMASHQLAVHPEDGES